MQAQTTETQGTEFTITGYFDAQTVSALEEDFQTLIEEGEGTVTLNLQKVDFIDSSGIGSIVFLFKRLKAKNRELVLSGVNGQPARLIQSLRVDKTITTTFIEEKGE